MEPTGFVAKHQASINQGRRTPDRSPCAISPNNLAFVTAQAIEITIARANVHSSIRDDRACPKSTLLFSGSAEGLVFPDQFAVSLAEAVDVAVLRSGINEAITDGRSGI